MKTNVMILPARNGFSGDGFVKREGSCLTVCLRGASGDGAWWCAKDEAHELTERRGDAFLYRGPADAKMPETCAVIALRGHQAICLLGIGDYQRLTEDFAQKRGLTVSDDILKAMPVNVPDDPPQKIPVKAAEEAEPEPREDRSLAAAVNRENSKISESIDVPEHNEIPGSAAIPGNVKAPERIDIPGNGQVPAEPPVPPTSFWECSAAAMEQLFEERPAEEELAMLIPGSRWAQVENDGAPYIVGMIYDDDREPLFLCYGFPMPWAEDPPEVLEGYSQWVPKDFSHPHDDGYWMIYVNARTGERVT